jgi:hypothetical protein
VWREAAAAVGPPPRGASTHVLAGIRRAVLAEFLHRARRALRKNSFGITQRRLADLAGVGHTVIRGDLRRLVRDRDAAVAERGGYATGKASRYAEPEFVNDYSTPVGITRASAREACWRRACAAVPSSAGVEKTVKARAAARRALLLDYARELRQSEGPGFYLGVEEVAERLGVSEPTARRDLAALRRTRELQRLRLGNSHTGRVSTYTIPAVAMSAAA